ncbi:MAG: SDR family oxidoreductase [Armatimonadota bacterium]
MSTFMVTGGAGFIGSHITELLLNEGHEVVVFDNFSTGREVNIQPFANRIEVVRGDIRDANALDGAMVGVDYVIHHAAEVSAIKSVEEPLWANEVNVTGTLNVLESAKRNGVKRMVLASSSAIYGDTGKQPQSEANLPSPLSPYGATKICGEHYCTVFNEIYGVETVRLRYFNVFGPRQNPKSQYAAVIPKFIDRLLSNQPIHIYGDGEQTRDFVFVKDVARANYIACLSDKAPGEVFNIAGGRSVSVNELARILIEVTGRKVEIIHDAPVLGEIKYSAAANDKAREVLGFTPLVSFENGLKDVVEYLEQQR